MVTGSWGGGGGGGGEGLKNKRGGGQANFYPYRKKGEVEKVSVMLRRGHTKC